MLRHLLIFYSIYEFLAFIVAFECRFFLKNCSEGSNEKLIFYLLFLFCLFTKPGFRYTAMLAHSISSPSGNSYLFLLSNAQYSSSLINDVYFHLPNSFIFLNFESWHQVFKNVTKLSIIIFLPYIFFDFRELRQFISRDCSCCLAFLVIGSSFESTPVKYILVWWVWYP